MKSKSLKVGIILNLIVTLVIGILTFCVNKYFAVNMGGKELGLMRLFTQMVVYLSLAELGLGMASAYSLYKPLANKDIEQISVVVSTVGNIYRRISIFILIVGLILNPIIPFFIKDKIPLKEIYTYWTLYVINTSLSYSFAKFTVLFTANQEFEFVRIVQGISRILSQCLQIYILLVYKSFIIFILILILENFLQFIVYKLYYKKYYSYIKNVKKREKKIFTDLINLFWHKIGGLIVFNTDYIIISKFISLKMVGIYSSYIMVINIISIFIGILTNVLSPRIGKYISENTTEDIFNLWQQINIIFIFIATISTYLTYKTITPFLNLWLGKEYILSSTTTFLIMINLYISSSRVIIDIFKNGYGFFNDVHLPIIEGILNLMLSLVLVRYIGIDGVIIGTIASNICIILLAKPILVFKECFKKKWSVYLKILINYLVLMLITICFSEIIILKFIKLENINSWLKWIFMTIKFSLITTGVGIIIFYLNKEFRGVIKELKRKV